MSSLWLKILATVGVVLGGLGLWCWGWIMAGVYSSVPEWVYIRCAGALFVVSGFFIVVLGPPFVWLASTNDDDGEDGE